MYLSKSNNNLSLIYLIIQLFTLTISYKLSDNSNLISFLKNKINYPLIISDYIIHPEGDIISSLNIGTPPQRLQLQVDLNNDFSWISTLLFKSNSTTLYRYPDLLDWEKRRIHYINAEYSDHTSVSPYDINIQPNISSNKQFTFSFFLISFGHTKYQSLALSRKYHNDRFNIVKNMKKAKLISKAAFTIIPDESKFSAGKIIFGEISSQTMLEHEYNIGKIKSIQKQDYEYSWGVKLNKIHFNFTNKEYIYKCNSSNNFAIFQTTFNGVQVPPSFLNYLRNIINTDQSLKNSCKMTTKQSGYIFQCNENISQYLNEFIFDFGEVQFNLDNLIKRENDNKYSLLIGNFDNEHNIIWIFGNIVLEKYLLMFDMDDDYVRIFSKEKLQIFNTSLKNKKYLFGIINILLHIGIIINVIVKLRFTHK